MAKVKVNPRIAKAEKAVKKLADKITGIYSATDYVLIRALKGNREVFFRVFDNGNLIESTEDPTCV